MPSRPPGSPKVCAPTARVVVTGGAGFIGAALVRELLKRGVEVVCVDDLSTGKLERLPEHSALSVHVADVAEAPALAEILRGLPRCDALVHLAARVGVRAVLRDPEGCRRANEEGVRQLVRALDALHPAERPRVLAASSSEVYADSDAPLAESADLRAEDANGRWAYAASKLAGERMLDRAADLWPLHAGPVHLRFFNVVGPGQDAEGGMVLPIFVEHALARRPLPVHGDGRQVRTFAHVDEVARALAELVLYPALPSGPLNVGGRARASVLELAQCVARLSGSEAGIHFVDPRARLGRGFEDVRWREPDLARLAALGIEPPAMELDALVADMLARHRTAAGEARRAAPGAGRPACASPAS